MEEKRSSGRSKRQKPPDEGSWDCSVCTYRNSQEAYKCEMCDVRKGTSTRKPRVTSQLVAQQVAQHLASPALSPLPTPSTSPIPTPTPPAPLPPPAPVSAPVSTPAAVPLGPPPVKKEKSSSSNAGKEKKTGTKTKRVPRLRNVDRSTARHMSVTVGTVTVVITDYKPKAPKPQDIPNGVQSDASDTSSSAGMELHEEHAVVNSLEQGTVKHE